MEVGAKIKSLRENKNLTQTEMAIRLGLSLSGYVKIERNETDVSLKRLYQIAETLDTDLNTLLELVPKQIFNQSNNKTANANGIVQHQQIICDQGSEDFFTKIKADIDNLKENFKTLKNKR